MNSFILSLSSTRYLFFFYSTWASFVTAFCDQKWYGTHSARAQENQKNSLQLQCISDQPSHTFIERHQESVFSHFLHSHWHMHIHQINYHLRKTRERKEREREEGGYHKTSAIILTDIKKTEEE